MIGWKHMKTVIVFDMDGGTHMKPFKTYVVVATVGWKHMKHMSTYENI